jgi:hypothetical protein
MKPRSAFGLTMLKVRSCVVEWARMNVKVLVSRSMRSSFSPGVRAAQKPWSMV